jgi:hypothetical protein
MDDLQQMNWCMNLDCPYPGCDGHQCLCDAGDYSIDDITLDNEDEVKQ